MLKVSANPNHEPEKRCRQPIIQVYRSWITLQKHKTYLLNVIWVFPGWIYTNTTWKSGWHATQPSSTARHNKGSVCSTLDLQTKTDAGCFLSVYGYGAVPPVVVGRQCSQYLKCHVTTGQDEEGFWNVRTFWGEVLRFGEKLPTSMPMRANRREKQPRITQAGSVCFPLSQPTVQIKRLFIYSWIIKKSSKSSH